MDTFPYLGYEDGECTTEFRTRLNRGQAIGPSLQKMWKSHSIPISMKIQLMKALVWLVAVYGCESWTLKKELKKHEWVLNKAGVKRDLLDTVKAKKLAYHEDTRVAWRKR